MNAQPKVSVGVTTYAGYSGTLAGVILAVYAYANGDHTAGTVGTIAAAVAFGLTQVFRYVQAVVLAKQQKSAMVGQILAGSTGASLRQSAANPQTGGPTIPTGFPTTPPSGTGPLGLVNQSSASVAAEEADLPPDDVELQNVPRPESAFTPAAPEGEPPGGVGETPPLQPGDTEG